MTDSAARAERFEAEASAVPCFTWAVPQKPVSVRIPLPLIEKLEREAVESYRSLTSRGSEIGGLLFGTVSPGNPALVEIESYETVPCDYASGPLYHLSPADLARLDSMLAGRRAVGFFRSQTRKGLALDAADLALLDSRFPGAQDIALIVRPSATKSSVGGIFIREDGKFRAEASYLEFPFRSSQQELKTPQASVAGPRSVQAAPAAPIAPKPAVRAQIVPIASRRDILPAPLPVEPPAPAEPAVEAPAPEPVRIEPEPTMAAPEPAPVKSSGKLLWILLGAAASAVLVGGLLFTSGMLRLHKTPVPAVTADAGLALRIERNAGDILLTWNRDASAIRHATHAVLSIDDGPQHENVEMDLSQLRTGSIVYSPVTGDVVFEMKVTADGQNQPVAETVRVLRTRPSPMPEQATPAAATPVEQPAATPADEPKEEKIALTQAVKPFYAESLAQRLRPTRPQEVADAPAPTGAAPVPAVNGNLGGIIGTTVVPPKPPAPAPAVPAPEKKLLPGGQIEQAQLLHRRDPEYPKLAREAGASGTVEVTATIGTDGHVKAVNVIKGHPLLRQAAVDAVKQWIYRPTLLNGNPVETETQILLNFKSER